MPVQSRTPYQGWGAQHVRPAAPQPQGQVAPWQRAARPGGAPQMPTAAPQAGPLGFVAQQQAQMDPFGGLQQLMGMLPQTPGVMDYGAGAWNLPPQGEPAMAAGASPAQTGITTGITPPAQIPQPTPMTAPSLPGWLNPQAVTGNLAAFLQPMATEAMGQYYADTAGLQNAFQGAQAQAGLNWGQMIPQMGRLQAGQQGNLLNLLAGLV